MKKFLFAMTILLWASTAHAASWYVDSTATGANNGTSWANAWKAFSSISWSSVSPGDTVYISGGTTSQTYTSTLSVGKSGTSGNPITIMAGQDSGHNGTVIIDGGGGTGIMLNLGGNNYVTINGNYSGQRHIVIQNNSLAGDNPLVYSSGNGGSSQSGYITGNHITYVDVNSSGTGLRWNYGYLNEIDHCYFHNISDEAAIAVNGSCSYVDPGSSNSIDMSQYNLWDQGCLVHDNTIQVNCTESNSGSGPDAIQGTHGISVYNNSIYGALGTIGSTPNHQDGVQIGGSYYKIYNNTIYGTANSMITCNWRRTVEGFTHVWNNVFAESQGQSNSHGIEQEITTAAQIQDFKIYNNTFVDFTGYIAIRMLFDNGSGCTLNPGAVDIKNNIIYNVSLPVQIGSCNYVSGGVTMDHNNINAGSHGGTGCTVNGSSFSPTNSQTGAPSFASYSQYNQNNDLHLASSSTADIGTGLNLSTYLTTDMAGTARPATGAWDMGAYVYGGTVVQQQPLPPVLNAPVLK